jgi:hypothetical protein
MSWTRRVNVERPAVLRNFKLQKPNVRKTSSFKPQASNSCQRRRRRREFHQWFPRLMSDIFALRNRRFQTGVWILKFEAFLRFGF